MFIDTKVINKIRKNKNKSKNDLSSLSYESFIKYLNKKLITYEESYINNQVYVLPNVNTIKGRYFNVKSGKQL